MFKRKLKTLLLQLVETRLKSIQKNSLKTTEIHYLMTFPDNDQGLIQALIEAFGHASIKVGYQKNCENEAKKWQEKGIEIYPLNYSLAFFRKSLKELLRAEVLIVDNYIAFLGKLRLYSNATFFQIWHANGAIKRFGWEDYQTHQRGEEEKKRFQEVYNAIDYYVVGSDEMERVFKSSYHISKEKILKIGVPRTDYFFDEKKRREQENRFSLLFPESVHHTVVVYCPTYRVHEKNISEKWDLGEDYVLFEKKHPHQGAYILDNQHVIRDFKGMTLSDILFSVDVLVTDYSSVPFEYVLAQPKGNVYLYWYDSDTYQQHIGLQQDSNQIYQEMIVENREELLNRIVSEKQLNNESLQKWNTYNDGNATKRLVKIIRDTIDKGE